MKKKKKLKENVKILVRAMTIFAARKKSDQKSILKIDLCSGKGVIPYEIINSFDSLDIVSADDEFCKKDDFHHALKNTKVADKEYESIEKFYILMKMRRRPQYFVQFSENYHFLQNF